MKSNQIKRGRPSVVTPAMARKALALCSPANEKPLTLRALGRRWHVSHAAISRAIRRLPAALVS